MMKSFQDCEKVLSGETENRVEKKGFIKDEVTVKFGQLKDFQGTIQAKCCKVFEKAVIVIC